MSEPIIIPESEKGYRCEVLAASVNREGIRLTTMRWKYPLMVHAEACRHRAFSRSVASNRAIPTPRIIAMVEQDPVLPVWWGKNQSGMQAEEELGTADQQTAKLLWLEARNNAVEHVQAMQVVGVHKQIANRILAPFQWVTEVVTATDWANFFALRCHPAAQPEMRKIAEMAQRAYVSSLPKELVYGAWHLPLILPTECGSPEVLAIVSAARCARTSYRTHEGRISTIDEDMALYERLVGQNPKHASPTEHPAEAVRPPWRGQPPRYGNLRGWRSLRYWLENHTAEDAPYRASGTTA